MKVGNLYFPQRQASGFTLLELLVVLILVGIVSGLMFQASSTTLNVYGRLVNRQQAYPVLTLQTTWFQSTVAGTVASLDASHALKGDSHSFSGYTTTPLLQVDQWSKGGVGLVEYRWQLVSPEQGLQRLEYWQFGMESPWEIKTWRADEARFTYSWERAGSFQWPESPDNELKLPPVIQLLTVINGKDVSWLAPVHGRLEARGDIRDQL